MAAAFIKSTLHLSQEIRSLFILIIGLCLLLLIPAWAQGIDDSPIESRVSDCNEAKQLIQLASKKAGARSLYAGSLLHKAVGLGDEELVKMLVNCGVDINDRSSKGITPLMLAAQKGMFEIVLLVYSPLSELNATTPMGWTALHFAASSGCFRSAEFLMERGAEVNARTRNGTTPLSIALVRNHLEAIDTIEAYGGIE